MVELSTAQSGHVARRRDANARLKLLGGLLRLDGVRPDGFTAQELAAYAEVETETARAFLRPSKGPGYAEILSDPKVRSKSDSSGRPANLYRLRPDSREALLKHLAEIRRPLAAAEDSMSPAKLLAPIELLEETVRELERRSGDPDVWRERLSETRLELSGAMADFRALQSGQSPHAASFGQRLRAVQARIVAAERVGPPAAAQRKPMHDPLDTFVKQFGRWLGGTPASLEPVLVLLDGTSKASNLEPVLNSCRAANVHVAQFDMLDMPVGEREKFYGCLDYLRGTTPLAASDVVLALDGDTQMAQPLAKEFRELYELGKWHARAQSKEVVDAIEVDSDLLRDFYLAESASLLESSAFKADTTIAFVTRVNSALSAFNIANHVDGGYFLFGKPEQHRKHWLGAAHELMGDIVCVDFALDPTIKAAFAGYAVDYIGKDDLSKSLSMRLGANVV